MKDAYEVLQQKEADLARVRHEIESLQVVASLLSDDLTSDELTKKRAGSAAGHRGRAERSRCPDRQPPHIGRRHGNGGVL